MSEKQVSSDRKHYLISKKWSRETLMFWGTLSNDNEPRSFGGYTDDLRLCERYSFMDIVEHNNNYGNVHPFTPKDWLSKKFNDATFYISQEQLDEHFNKPALVILK